MANDFGFRVPFRMSPLSLLDLPEPTHLLETHGPRRVQLVASQPDGPLRDALQIAIRGEGFESLDAAREAGERWRDVVTRALARLGLGADFEDRAPFGTLTEAGERSYSAEVGHPVMSDLPGVTVFPHDPDLKFVRIRMEGCRRPAPDACRAAFVASAGLDHELTKVERLSFDLYSGSFFQPSADARFLMLMMAVETLLKPEPRSPEVRGHVRTLVEATKAAHLPTSERDSILGTLSWLLKESISQAGRRLAARLEPRTYADLTPSKFFTKCYEMRSTLVHANGTRPPRAEVDLLAAQLEVFVSNLLSGELLDAFAP